MTEITQADRDAVAEWLLSQPEEFRYSTTSLWKLLARHRIETEQKIIAWLREQDDPSEKWALQNSHWYAAAIEVGDHLR